MKPAQKGKSKKRRAPKPPTETNSDVPKKEDATDVEPRLEFTPSSGTESEPTGLGSNNSNTRCKSPKELHVDELIVTLATSQAPEIHNISIPPDQHRLSADRASASNQQDYFSMNNQSRKQAADCDYSMPVAAVNFPNRIIQPARSKFPSMFVDGNSLQDVYGISDVSESILLHEYHKLIFIWDKEKERKSRSLGPSQVDRVFLPSAIINIIQDLLRSGQISLRRRQGSNRNERNAEAEGIEDLLIKQKASAVLGYVFLAFSEKTEKDLRKKLGCNKIQLEEKRLQNTEDLKPSVKRIEMSTVELERLSTFIDDLIKAIDDLQGVVDSNKPYYAANESKEEASFIRKIGNRVSRLKGKLRHFALRAKEILKELDNVEKYAALKAERKAYELYKRKYLRNFGLNKIERLIEKLNQSIKRADQIVNEENETQQSGSEMELESESEADSVSETIMASETDSESESNTASKIDFESAAFRQMKQESEWKIVETSPDLLKIRLVRTVKNSSVKK